MVFLRGCPLSVLWVACLHLSRWHDWPGLSLFFIPFLSGERSVLFRGVFENVLFCFFHGDLLLCIEISVHRNGLGWMGDKRGLGSVDVLKRIKRMNDFG